jgi:hypothetical protein
MGPSCAPALVARAEKHDRIILQNKSSPTAPTMAPAVKMTAQAFLADMSLILPIRGMNVFRIYAEETTSMKGRWKSCYTRRAAAQQDLLPSSV